MCFSWVDQARNTISVLDPFEIALRRSSKASAMKFICKRDIHSTGVFGLVLVNEPIALVIPTTREKPSKYPGLTSFSSHWILDS
jgi:hypothetical protein